MMSSTPSSGGRSSTTFKEVNHRNGLVRDKTQEGGTVQHRRGRDGPGGGPAPRRARGSAPRLHGRAVLTKLRFFWNSPQGPEPDATGYKGFYYHFLDMETGRRVWECELSTIDSAFLLAGMLTAATYFDHDTEDEHEIRTLADALYRRADWRWAQNGGATLTHGWRPESGFIPHRWEGYDEGLLLYVLGLGSPTYPLPEESYAAWTATYQWKEIYGHEYLYSGPLFTHQLSHMWIDFRGIQDAFMRDRGIDYFENSRRATYVQREYAIRNPLEFEGYGEQCWGITASDGPGWTVRTINGIERRFFDYIARGAPYGPDDGTIAPWAVVASLPFAPEIVLPTIRNFADHGPGHAPAVRLQGDVQPDVPGGGEAGRLGVALSLRDRPGADRPDDRELPHGLPLGPDEAVPLHRHGASPGRVHGGLVVTWCRESAIPAAISKRVILSPLARAARINCSR